MNRLNFNLTRKLLQRALWLFVVAWMAISETQAQVSYSFNFDANSTGWTGNFTRFTNVAPVTTCGASVGSMRRNLWSGATTGQLISPLTGTATGGLITIGYAYKAQVWSANNVAAPVPVSSL